MKMIIKVSGITNPNFLTHNQEKRQTKYYKPQENKNEVKEDFGLVLDGEIKKLTINVLI